MSQTEGLRVNDCDILGISAVRNALGPGEAHYILALREAEALVVKRGSKTAAVYFLAHDGSPVDWGPSLREAVERLLSSVSDECR